MTAYVKENGIWKKSKLSSVKVNGEWKKTNKGFVKVLLGISKGRKKQDLREYKKKQDWKRDKQKLGSQ